MDKKFSDKIKEGVSVREIEDFARKYTTEVFCILAIIIATISSCWDFFLNGPKLALFFLALGSILGVLFPVPIENALKKIYNFAFKQEKSTQIILGSVKLVVSLFMPFIIFALLGLLAGTAYHYFVRHAQLSSGNRFSGRDGEYD